MSPITTHVLDTATGKPASGIEIALQFSKDDTWSELNKGVTNDDGRITDLLEEGTLKAGRYRMVFATADYFERQKSDTFYPVVTVEFAIKDADDHYHVPLLLSPFGYSTYRGS